MKNILYYIKEFGNKSFEEFPFNDVDSLILSQISYLSLIDFIPDIANAEENISLIDCLSEENIQIMCDNTLDERRNKKLLNLLKVSTRYKKMNVNYLQDRFYVDKVEQFFAITFIFDDFSYIAYRGTDLSILGWQEDFNMTLLDVIPAQDDAARYIDRVCKLLNYPKIYVGGHSKGGNLAVYASLYCIEDIQNNIIKIFNHDGPGFNKDIFDTDQFKRIENRIVKMTCKEAMIGILLHHTEKMQFVDSRSVSILQHDPYNWKITKLGGFKYVKQANLFSRAFGKTVRNFLESTSVEERKVFLETAFFICMETKTSTIFDIKTHPIKYFRGMKKRYKSLDYKRLLLFKRLMKRYRVLFKHNLKLLIKRRFNFNSKIA